ncbi:MAG: hypothetical protein HON98_10995 [Chloroflexi bacterium]|jgi:hypothetical protein|nr:hypothetical protein [Chloroflexota bacterium]MBT3670503.1 hypothetical protein [Chloroflexota bacterium]MBT4306487.1 hypothetical protein [Chloroflexota bacterium]MBT4534890.1 hypothetical protein [Chloroflexota bacterium]MBT4681559.1 hypothetical protein [Chloroflexota bacterium]
MPNLIQSLSEQDLGQLHIIADLWGVDLNAPDKRDGRRNLSKLLLNAELIEEILESLTPEAKVAIEEIHKNDDRMPWLQFIHRYGELREMGPGKRDREKPHQNPSSISETLWYRAFIARAFLDTPNGPKEFAFIPEDLAALFPKNTVKNKRILFGRPATKNERGYPLPATDSIVDNACTILAALRIGYPKEDLIEISAHWAIQLDSLLNLMRGAGLIDGQDQPIAEATQEFLQLSREETILRLYQVWMQSSEINDLRECPQFEVEAEPLNDPLQTRKNIFKYLGNLDQNIWWSISAFTLAIKNQDIDFQRKAGEYDSWFIKDRQTGSYLRGMDNWDKVEGELIRYFLTGPMHWLGLIDLASNEDNGKPIAFRFSGMAKYLLKGSPSKSFIPIEEKVNADSKLLIHVPRMFARTLRYQISRFCEWEGIVKENYRYRITAKSLERAHSQGLLAKQLLSLLQKNASSKIPPNLVHALERWEQFGTQAKIEEALILKVKQPAILEKLKKSRAARFLLEPLGPTSIIVKAGAWEKVMEALGEMGYMSDGPAKK